jgi:hypothetical protein
MIDGRAVMFLETSTLCVSLTSANRIYVLGPQKMFLLNLI